MIRLPIEHHAGTFGGSGPNPASHIAVGDVAAIRENEPGVRQIAVGGHSLFADKQLLGDLPVLFGVLFEVLLKFRKRNVGDPFSVTTPSNGSRLLAKTRSSI